MDSAEVLASTWFTSEDVASEQAVLGSMLVDEGGQYGAVALAVAELSEDDFVLDYDRALFAAFKTKFLTGEITDPVTILDTVGPGDKRMLGYLHQLRDITPSDRKTALALHMAYAQAATLKVGFFSLETSLPKLAVWLAAPVSGVPLEHIKKRSLRQDEYMLIASAAVDISKRRLTFVEASNWTVDQIAARTLARRFDVIYVDYLQIVESSVRRLDRTPEVADISRALANFARRNKASVVALSQLSRPAQKTKRVSPVLADLRESGQIEQDADVAMFIWRQTEASSKSKRFLTLAKNKEGQMGDWELIFRGDTQKFVPELSGCSVPASVKRPEQMQFSELSGDDPDMPF